MLEVALAKLQTMKMIIKGKGVQDNVMSTFDILSTFSMLLYK
jgi:hypothetical protein